MNALVTMNPTTELTVDKAISPDLYYQFIAYIDAAPKTVDTYKKALRQLFLYFGANGITQPTREDVMNFKETLKAEGKKASTIQNYITAAKLFFRWTAQVGRYPNITDHLKGVKLGREHRKDNLTSYQVKSVIEGIERESLKGKRDFAIFALMTACGLRTIEVIRADIGDFRPLGDDMVLFIQGKGRSEKDDRVRVPPIVEKAIREYLAARGESGEAAPLFASISRQNAGERMTTRAISGIIKGRLRDAGLNSPRLTAHSLRHTAVTIARDSGEAPENVQQFARHANIATTMIYYHEADKSMNTCSRAIENAIFG